MTVDDEHGEDDRDEVRQASYTFIGSVQTKEMYTGGPAGDDRGAATGTCTAGERSKARRGYVRPVEFEPALTALRTSFVVVLTGAPGVGKRCGALNLLDHLGAAKIRRMSPATSLAALSDFSFKRNHGYVIEGRLADRTDVDGRASAEFSWRKMCTAIEAAKAFLVITSDGPPTLPREAAVVRWTAPDVADLITSHLAYDPPVDLADDDVPRLVEACRKHACTPREIAAVVARVREGLPLDEAIASLSSVGCTTVDDWFDAPERLPKDLLAVTTLAFVHDAPLRTFEVAYAGLDSAFRSRRGDDDNADQDQFAKVRLDRMNELVTYRVSAPAGRELGTTRNVVFSSPEFRGYVVDALWDRYGEPFWTPVFEWLQELPRRSSWGLIDEIGRGVAEMMRVAPDDTRPVVDAWARGFARQQLAAAITVNHCAVATETPTLALQVAMDWSRSGDVRAVRTACMAFGGFLGARYPTDAIGELWRSAHRELTADAACGGFAAMLLIEGESGATASYALKFLERTLAALAEPGADQRRRRVLHDVIRSMLTAFDGNAGRRAIAAHLTRRPTDVPRTALLWADLLRTRPRRTALDALRHSVVAGLESTDLARSLIHSVHEALPELERPLFIRDLGTDIRRATHPDERSAAVLDILKELR
jgi:hypothetical protein